MDADPLPPHIWRLIAPIVPAVRRVMRQSIADGNPTDPIDAEDVGREHLRDTWSACLPMLAWLDEHVGPPAEPAPSRR